MIFICIFVLFIHSIQCIPTDNTGPTTENTVSNITDIKDEADLITLLKNLRGKCGYENDIIDLMVERTESERQKLIDLCTKRYKKNLIAILEHRFIGDTYGAMVALLTPHQKLPVVELYNAISGLGTDEHAISEILGTMNKSEIVNTSAVYQNEYQSSLKEDLISDTSGPFQDLLVALCDAVRDENEPIDNDAAVLDARALIAAGEGKNDSADEKTFITIMTTRSYPQLKVIFDEFEKSTNKSILQVIPERFSGDFQYCLSILGKTVLQSKGEFYARQLEEALSYVLYDDHQLTRIIVGRSEMDLNDIKEAYKNIYGIQLVDRISAKIGTCAYNRLLISLLKR